MERHDDVSLYDRLVWADGELERALVGGARRRDAQAYLGEHEYAALVPLAQAAAAATRDADCCVHLVPGIMGSQLGLRRAEGEPPDLLWVDPIDVRRGRLTELRLDNDRIVSLGAVPHSYLALKLRLEAAGFTVRWFDYDWRRGIDELGAQLAARIDADRAKRQLLLGHSMGGLVARAALTGAADRVARVVTLGTPHEGSYAPLQALRGSYVSVRRIVQLDPGHSAEELTQQVFGGFPSLYQMLPVSSDGPDLRDASHWPDSPPHPQPALLREVGRLQLPAPADKLYCIAGCGFDTVTHIEREPRQFRYVIARQGDGTVPSGRATLAGHPAWHAEVLHGELPRDARIADAAIDLLSHGQTTRLSQTEPATTNATRSITDAELRAACTDKLDWAQMTPAQRHQYFESLNAPVAAGSLMERHA